MASERLTDIRIRNLKPTDRQYEIWDANVSGLAMRVSPGGTKSFVLLYRSGNRQRRLTLGRYPALSLSEARKQASSAMVEVALGKDPASEKLKRRQDPYAFSEFVETFIESYAKRKNKSWAETRRVLVRDFVKVWRRRDIRHITKQDVTAVIERIVSAGNPSAANHAFAQIRKLFNWAVERDAIEISPCQGLKSPAKHVSRDKVLNDTELAAIWSAANEMNYPFGAYIKLLFLTAQRKNEVASIRWSNLDLDQEVWSIPAEQNKSGRPHEVPLTKQAIALIRAIPKCHDVYVFPARGKDNPISGFSKWKKKIDKLSATSGWTLHDMRRTAATGMAKLKVEPHVVERVLNHSTGSLGGVAGIYNRFGYLDEMREALSLWAEHIEEVIEKQGMEPMPRRVVGAVVETPGASLNI